MDEKDRVELPSKASFFAPDEAEEETVLAMAAEIAMEAEKEE